MMRSRFGCMIVVMLAIPLARPHHPLRPLPAAVSSGGPLSAPERRSACGVHAPMRVELRAMATPVVGQELTLKFSAGNRGLAGPFECRIRTPDGALTPLDGPLVWMRELPVGEVVSWTARVRVELAGPIALTAKARSLALSSPFPASEGYLTLYPFELESGQLRPTWNESTLQPLGRQPLPVISLPDGGKAIVFDVGGSIASVSKP